MLHQKTGHYGAGFRLNNKIIKMTSLITEAKRLLEHTRKWTVLERAIEKKVKELEACKKALQEAKHPKHTKKHSKRYAIIYKELHILTALKKKIAIDIEKIEADLRKELERIKARIRA